MGSGIEKAVAQGALAQQLGLQVGQRTQRMLVFGCARAPDQLREFLDLFVEFVLFACAAEQGKIGFELLQLLDQVVEALGEGVPWPSCKPPSVRQVGA